MQTKITIGRIITGQQGFSEIVSDILIQEKKGVSNIILVDTLKEYKFLNKF